MLRDRLRQFQVLVALTPLLLTSIACAPLSLYWAPTTPDESPPAVESIEPLASPRAMVPTFTPTATDPPPTLTPTPTLVPTPTPIRTGSIIDVAYLDTYSIETINGLITRFYPAEDQVLARYAVDRYQIHFETVNESGTIVPIRAELFIPKVDAPIPFPLFVYGAGTTGIGNGCAPLDEALHKRNWGNYRTHMLSYAAQGYIGALPLWQGYDDITRTHPYFISELEGYIMLDATRAVYNFFRQASEPEVHARPLDAVFFGGYSQGAHGAFAADKMAKWYAPELPLKGVIGHASAPSVEALLLERPSLGPYIVYAYRDYYGADIIDPSAVFLPRWLATFSQDASTKCVDEAYGYYSSDPQQMYRPEFLDALLNDRLGDEFPDFKRELDTNYAGTWANPDTPILMAHGAADPVVTPQTAESFVAHLCRLGKRVTFTLYPGVNHFVTRQYSFVETLTWMSAILNGEQPRSDCAAFAEN